MNESHRSLLTEIELLGVQIQTLEARIVALEMQNAARLHALEVGLARLSHGPAEPTAVQPRRIVDDRGVVIMLRESAA